MKSLIEFFSFTDPNIRYVVFGSILLAASASVVGTFTFLKKRALTGDAVAHSVLPGICLAFIISGTKNPLVLIPGAFITGWLSLVIMDFVVRNSKIKEDTAIGLILSVFFGIGILLLTFIQKSGNASQSGLDQFLFGKAASLVGADLYVFAGLALVLLTVVFLFYKELTLLAFDATYTKVIGFPVRTLELILTSLTVLAVVVGIQAVGVVLMAALLITPAAAARFWTNSLPRMILYGAIFSSFSGLVGAYISLIAPAMPTGPWIVLVISLIAVFSFFFAPEKGIMSRYLKQRRNRIQILEDNILKMMFQLGEPGQDFYTYRSKVEMNLRRKIPLDQLNLGLKRLQKQGFILADDNGWKITETGKNRGQRVVKLHRLWEVYLTQYLRLAPDHVHDDAETIEHIITPEIELKLEQLLDHPSVDPHATKIPY
jgi:manganese/zinc/iron transport system permease protein